VDNVVVRVLSTEYFGHCVWIAMLIQSFHHHDTLFQLGLDKSAEDGDGCSKPAGRPKKQRLVEPARKAVLPAVEAWEGEWGW
jgi:hypothetical protein